VCPSVTSWNPPSSTIIATTVASASDAVRRAGERAPRRASSPAAPRATSAATAGRSVTSAVPLALNWLALAARKLIKGVSSTAGAASAATTRPAGHRHSRSRWAQIRASTPA
jgi:hypothetical protein